MSPRFFDAIDMLFGPAHHTVRHVAAILRVEPGPIYACLRELEVAGLVEGTKRETPREGWYSNVGDGGPAALVARIEEMGQHDLLERALE